MARAACVHAEHLGSCERYTLNEPCILLMVLSPCVRVLLLVLRLTRAEHLGSCERYTLKSYLSIGENDGGVAPDDMYNEAMRAIFEEDKPCHR